MSAYRNFAWLILAACVGVILFGAYVRASGSGAGCGAHWPLCNGELVPETGRQKTLVEFSHRLTSAVLLIGCGGLLLWAWRLFPARSFGRRAAQLSAVAVVLEALIGAMIVLVRLVENDKSLERVISVPLHLVNTLFLLATITCAALSAQVSTPRWRWRDSEGRLWPLILVAGFGVLGGLGAVAALGDFSGDSHLAEQIRVLHPFAAVAWAAAVFWWLTEKLGRPEWTRHIVATLALLGLNILLGITNVLLLAPIWLQIVHLFVGILLWIVFVAFLFRTSSEPA
jgi:heme A synthase